MLIYNELPKIARNRSNTRIFARKKSQVRKVALNFTLQLINQKNFVKIFLTIPRTLIFLYSLSELTFTLFIFRKKEVFAIEHSIGKLRNPVAYNHHSCISRKHQVELYVSVSIDEIVYVGVSCHILFCEQHQMLFMLTHVGRFFSVDTLQTGVLSPLQSETHSPTRMQAAEEELAHTVVED